VKSKYARQVQVILCEQHVRPTALILLSRARSDATRGPGRPRRSCQCAAATCAGRGSMRLRGRCSGSLPTRRLRCWKRGRGINVRPGVPRNFRACLIGRAEAWSGSLSWIPNETIRAPSRRQTLESINIRIILQMDDGFGGHDDHGPDVAGPAVPRNRKARKSISLPIGVTTTKPGQPARGALRPIMSS
jgi:hypothetical protein